MCSIPAAGATRDWSDDLERKGNWQPSIGCSCDLGLDLDRSAISPAQLRLLGSCSLAIRPGHLNWIRPSERDWLDLVFTN
ncbi:hypothetical protein J6590_057432 [Homalodisca vitripennis]|nr:hypothetical protein J6590_057432 [Homalodisca vitripennis]